MFLKFLAVTRRMADFMKEHSILLSGPTIVADQALLHELQQCSHVLPCGDNKRIAGLLATKKIDLILLEISPDNPAEIEIIKALTARFPDKMIILIDGEGDREVIAQAFAYGTKDAFRKPYNCQLIAERVKALLENNPLQMI